MKKEENKNNKLLKKDENNSLNFYNNYNIRVNNINKPPNLMSPSKLSMNSKLSFVKEASTDEINIYNNLKNEIILINPNIKNANKLKEEKNRNNNIGIKLQHQSTNRFPSDSNDKNKILDYPIQKEKHIYRYRNDIGSNNNDFNNRCNINSDINREIKDNKSNNDDININVKKSIQCLFCEKICLDTEYFKNFNCQHYFCKKCGKIFYQYFLDKGENNNNFKCPVFSCLSHYSLKFIKSLISLKFNNDINTNNKNILNYSERNISLKVLDSKDFFISNDNIRKKNIIDINDNDNFYKYIKKFLFECPMCKEISLYGNINGPYFKCLKCLKNFCKYCREEYNYSHFDLSYAQHCKIFYRLKYKKEKKTINIIFFFKYIFIFIGAFLFIMTFFVNKIKYSFKIKNKCKKIIYVAFYIVLSLIFTPLSLLMIPYFPIICSI